MSTKKKTDEQGGERTTHLGVHWYRDRYGVVSFYDESPTSSGEEGEWVRWRAGGDAPPLPPNWQLLGVPTKFSKAGWRSPWRWAPALVVLVAVIIGIVQGLGSGHQSSADAVTKEAKQAASFAGQCWAQDGTAAGHPKYSTKSVPCDSNKAAVKVVTVLPPKSDTLCPKGTTGVELPYRGVEYPHVECLQPLHPTG